MALQPIADYHVIASQSSDWRGNLLVQWDDQKSRITDELHQNKPFIEGFPICYCIPGDCHGPLGLAMTVVVDTRQHIPFCSYKRSFFSKKGAVIMEIRLACKTDIPGMIELLKQVGEVHHKIRPDLFRGGAQKYNEADLEELLQDELRPIFVGLEDGKLLGYCFCMIEEVKDNPVLRDVKSLYIDDLCVDETCRGKHVGSRLYD